MALRAGRRQLLPARFHELCDSDKRYPGLLRRHELPALNSARRNVFWECGPLFTTCDAPSADKFDLLANAEYAAADPGFVAADKGDFHLQPDAEVFRRISFRPIPADEIGLYQDEYRATWPVDEGAAAPSRRDGSPVKYQPKQLPGFRFDQRCFLDRLAEAIQHVSRQTSRPVVADNGDLNLKGCQRVAGGRRGVGGWRPPGNGVRAITPAWVTESLSLLNWATQVGAGSGTPPGCSSILHGFPVVVQVTGERPPATIYQPSGLASASVGRMSNVQSGDGLVSVILRIPAT